MPSTTRFTTICLSKNSKHHKQIRLRLDREFSREAQQPAAGVRLRLAVKRGDRKMFNGKPQALHSGEATDQFKIRKWLRNESVVHPVASCASNNEPDHHEQYG